MKKARFLVLALVVSVMLIGAGYAYWTDALVINNTVSTGELLVEFVNDSTYPKIFGRTGETYISKDIIVHEDLKTATVTVGNMYPDSYVRYELKIINNGTIPAVFDNAVVEITQNQEGFTDALLIQVFAKKYHKDGTAYEKGEPGYWAGKSIGWKTVSELQTSLNTILEGCRLEPGEFITFDVPDEYLEEYLEQNPEGSGEQCVEIKLPASVGNADDPDQFENATASFNITLNWKQHNAE